MCGICGTLNPGPSGPDVDDMQRMVKSLRHRGPDSCGIVDAREAILGHARLSIIDLATGNQPMCTADSRLWIVFNGEIFNYLELRDELSRLGHQFRTRSDTEVILEGYREWGLESFSRFNGQWALALWDSVGRTLTLSRDPFGIRPLFYVLDGPTLVFASEIKALFQWSVAERRIDVQGLSEIFTFWAPVAPQTAFHGVFQVEPGAWMQISDGEVRSGRHFHMGFAQDREIRTASLDENAERFKTALVDAAKLRFERSDVSVSAYLSGGIDSTVTTAVLAEHTDAPLRTLSLGFSEEEYDETAFQTDVSEAFSTNHTSICVQREDTARVFPDVVWHAEQPILRTAPAPMYVLSRLARDLGDKVVVTGEGADEMLAGYDIFREALVRQFVLGGPEGGARTEILGQLYPWLGRSPKATPAFAEAFFRLRADPADPGFSHRPRWNTGLALRKLLTPDFREGSSDPVAKFLSALPDEFAMWDTVERAQYLETTTLMTGYLLSAQGDRMLMANSVEGRFPYLDPQVIRIATSLPTRHRIMGLSEKLMLKAAFEDLIPDEVLRRSKQPYRAPDAASFFGLSDVPDWIQYLTDNRAITAAGIFEPRRCQALFDKARANAGEGMSNVDNMRIVGFISTSLLHEKFVSDFQRETVPIQQHAPVKRMNNSAA